LSVAPHIRKSQQIWSLTRRARTHVGLSPQGEKQFRKERIARQEMLAPREALPPSARRIGAGRKVLAIRM